MQPNRVAHVGDSRLRFVFDDSVASFRLCANATFEDVARKWGELTPQHHGNPIAIDVTLAGSRSPSPASLHTASRAGEVAERS